MGHLDAVLAFVLGRQNPARYLEIRGTAVVEPDEDRAFAGRPGAKYDADLREHEAIRGPPRRRAHRTLLVNAADASASLLTSLR